MSTSSTESMPARRSASSTAIEPSLVAGTSVNAPPKVPTGVRTALTMTASSMPLTLRPDVGAQVEAGAERLGIPFVERRKVEPVALRTALFNDVRRRERPHAARHVG